MKLIRTIWYCKFADPTQLRLAGVGVDFVFLQEGIRREGRRRKNRNLALSRRNEPSCLNYGDCLVGVWKSFGKCLDGVRQVSGGCLEGVWRVCMGYPNGMWGV